MKTLKVLLLAMLIMAIASPADACECELCLNVEKTVEPEVSKVGDIVTYEICIENCGEMPVLVVGVFDSLLGDLTPVSASFLPSLWLDPNEEICLPPIDYEIPPGAPDPLVNTVTVIGTDIEGCCTVECTYDAEVDLVYPDFTVEKICPEVSKVGDEACYTVVITNTGETDLEIVDVNDSLCPLTNCIGVVLPPGGQCLDECCLIVPDDAPDPLVNTVTVTVEVPDLGNRYTKSDSCETDLVFPDFTVEKFCPPFSKVGDPVCYTVIITNTGETPLLILSVEDNVCSPLDVCVGKVLSPGEQCIDECCFEVPPGAPDPLINVVTVVAEVVGLGNILERESNPCVTDLVEPCISIEKACEPSPASIGDLITYTITICNCGDIALENIMVGDSLLGDLSDYFPPVLLPGQCDTQEVVRIIEPTDPSPLVNTAIVEATVVDLGNPVDANDSCTVEIPPPGEGCRLTGGGVDEEYSPEGVTALSTNSDRATFGGQAGANTALPPQPKGEWTHHQQKGLSGSFTFHAGTASSPAGSEIIEIRCSDPGGCKPSGDPPSPAKQLDFDGVGTFKNFGTKNRAPIWLFPDANAKCSSKGGKFRFDGTFHYFQVNADDLGEPGNKQLDASSPDICPPNGFGEKGDLPLGDCECADFYRITIYDGVDAAKVVWLDDENIDLNSLNTTDVIYEFHGYIDGGNLQIHHLTGYDINLTDSGLVSLNELAANWLEGV